MASTFEQQKQAQNAIAEAMAWALGMWFVPIPVLGSVACNKVESQMVHGILNGLGRPASEEDVDRFFWYFRKKYLIVNVVTFIPYVGATVQLLEVYALGQFVLTCIDSGINIGDDGEMGRVWAQIQPEIWRADDIILFYETHSGKAFPATIKEAFLAAVKQIGAFANGINKIPGLAKTQEVAGEALRQGSQMASGAIKAGVSGLKKLFS